MLTCFKSNIDALGFYKKIGFDIDETSPSKFGDSTVDYEIMSNN